ncbi:Pol protein [Phytophthora palmivora]|uniref:Pol protein n=1 Tax=Phytophthora palmivora TaxID=4796 RepID=A0A2P4YU50_9STRA|nr:Pol protein [Phytophthora palmivora]
MGVHARGDVAGLLYNLSSARSRFLACKQGKRELHELMQRSPSKRSIVTNSLVHPRQCGKATMRQQAQCRELRQPEPTRCRYTWNWLRLYRALSAVTKRSGTCNMPALREGKDRPVAKTSTQEPGELGSPVGPGRPNEEVLGVTDSNEGVAMSLATGHETKTHCQERGIVTTASPNAKSRRAVAVPDGTDQAGNIGPQAGNIGPQAAEAAGENAEGISCVGNIGPQVGNVVPLTAEAVEEDTESASGVGNLVPRKVEETKKNESAACVSSVGNEVPRGAKKTNTRAEMSWSTFRVDNQVPHSESETPPARPVEDQCHVFDGVFGRQVKAGAVQLVAQAEMPTLLNLEERYMKNFLAELKAGDIAEMVLLKPETSPEDLNSSSVMEEDVLEGLMKLRATRLGSDILGNPEDAVNLLVKGFSDVVSKHPPSQLPPDPGVRHEIDLVPGTKYCVTRQWPLPREQCEVIDTFFVEKTKSGMVRESKSPHSTPTFCVCKPSGKCRLVHAYNKLNNATVPAQTPIRRKDMLLNNMSGCTLYSALDLIDGYYQILMRESDIPLTAASIPSGMLWEWLVTSQGLSNASATFNCLVTQFFRPLRTFTQAYVNDISVHSRDEDGQTAMEVHLKHLRRVCEVMRANKLYADIDKVGVRANPGKVKAIAAWPTPRSQKDLRKWLGLVNYLHKVQRRDLLKKDADWVWEQQHQDAFDSMKASSQHAPVLALPNKSFSVDDEGRERVVSFQSRHLKAAERNYPVRDKELLAMKYSLVKFRVHPLGTRPFVIYTVTRPRGLPPTRPHFS